MTALDVVLTPVTRELRSAVVALAPLPEQRGYSGTAADSLPMAERDPARLAIVALVAGEPAGFFVLDTGRDVRAYAPAQDAVGMRGFYVDRRFQGRGIGTAVLRALPELVARTHPDAAQVALTVNVRNATAIRAYLRAGFEDTGRLFRGGALGPQHVLTLNVDAR